MRRSPSSALQLARCIDPDGPARKSLDAAIESNEHIRLAAAPRRWEAPDALSEIKTGGLPRVPARLWEYAVVGYERGLLTWSALPRRSPPAERGPGGAR